MPNVEGSDPLFVNFRTGKPVQVTTAAIEDGAVTTDKLADGAVATLKIADNAVTTLKIADANVTNAKLADMAQSTIKGRGAGAGIGVPQDLTATQATAILDVFGPDSGAGGLKGLAPATVAGDATKFLRGDGTWQAQAGGGKTLIASGSLTGTNIDIANIPATYAYLSLHLAGISMNTDVRSALVQLSIDNGLNFDATAGNYIGYNVSTAPGLINNATATVLGAVTTTAASAQNMSLELFGYQGGMFPKSNYVATGGSGGNFTGSIWYFGSTTAINALRILLSGTGSFDAGTYALYGVQ